MSNSYHELSLMLMQHYRGTTWVWDNEDDLSYIGKKKKKAGYPTLIISIALILQGTEYND